MPLRASLTTSTTWTPSSGRSRGRSCSSRIPTAARSSPTRASIATGRRSRLRGRLSARRGRATAELNYRFPGSKLGEDTTEVRQRPGGADLYLRPADFAEVYAADVPTGTRELMAHAQRPIDPAALNETFDGEPSGAGSPPGRWSRPATTHCRRRRSASWPVGRVRRRSKWTPRMPCRCRDRPRSPPRSVPRPNSSKQTLKKMKGNA